jgi:hypothetical protein
MSGKLKWQFEPGAWRPGNSGTSSMKASLPLEKALGEKAAFRCV